MLLGHQRCFKCRAERGVRNCPRFKNKVIGWKCCLELRVDLLCPPECPYAAKADENSPFPTFRADSNTEFMQTVRRHIDLWIYQKQEELDGQNPAEFAAQDKSKALAWLGKYRFPANFPMTYLLEKLDLPHEEIEEPASPETVSFAFLDAAIAFDWEKLRSFTTNDTQDPDLAKRYQNILSSLGDLKKLRSYQVLHAGAADDGISAMVVLELNRKKIWAVLLSAASGEWKIRQNYNGGPHLFYQQNKLFHDLAELLANGQTAQAREKISESLPSYPDCADLYYYRALSWQLEKSFKKAREDFLDALALDNHFFAAGLSLSALYLTEGKLEPARELLIKLHEERPDDLNVKNNLAACEAGLGNVDQARKMWQEILKTAPNYEAAQKNLERYPG